ncbi:ABC transporter substrate binding protein [Zhongshania borealis]|uniref:ABC transporter substrate-binding protein n=1 Tax=Zhongshania borealis TaxID=889488 RepID=A0ABP7WNA1_9GAMM
MKNLFYGIALYLILIPQAYTQNQKPVVDLILPAENSELEYISTKLSESPYFIVNSYINSIPDTDHRGEILLIISDKLLPLLENETYSAKFALYVNSINYQKYNYNKSAAIYSDQPLHRQLSLLTKIISHKITVGIPYESDDYKKQIELEINNFKEIDFLIVKTETNKLRSINKIIQKSDVILATSESSIYNSQNIRSILLSSYRHQKPIIGPTEGFVKAGSLASAATDSDQYITEIISMIKNYSESGLIPESRHPNSFSMKFNLNVAESLGINIPKKIQTTDNKRMTDK